MRTLKRAKHATLVTAVLALTLLPASLHAHAVVYPRTSTPGAYERYVLRVPNEKKVATTRVEIHFPAGLRVTSFEDVPGWQLEVLTDSAQAIVGAVWTGTLAPQRFVEFPFVAANPKTDAKLVWAAYQTYADGERVTWDGPEGSKTPASSTDIHAATGSPSARVALGMAAVAVLLSLVSLGLVLRRPPPTGAIALALVGLLAGKPVLAQSGAFVVTLGADTTAVEQYVRSGNTVTGDLVTRQGGTSVTHYVLTLNPDGTPATLVVTPRRADGSLVPGAYATATATYTADAFAAVISQRDTAMRRGFPVPAGSARLFPAVGGGIGPSIAMYEVLFAYMRSAHADSIPVLFLGATAARPGLPSWVKFVGLDSARIWLRFAPPTPAGPYAQFVRVDATGRVFGISGRETTQKIEARRVASLDVAAFATAFAAADAAGRGLVGTASAADSVRATVGTAHIAINYARPRVRGRDVFKNGVLGDTIWRTGANSATSFKTDVDLIVAGKTIPAGAYTLWTHVAPNNSAYELIFNKLTGEWGTDYHADQDAARVPLSVSSLNSPMEAFRIAVEPQGNGGVIALEWGTTRLSVPFALK